MNKRKILKQMVAILFMFIALTVVSFRSNAKQLNYNYDYDEEDYGKNYPFLSYVQDISVGQKVLGEVPFYSNRDFNVHEDAYFRIYLKKDCIYKVSVFDIKKVAKSYQNYDDYDYYNKNYSTNMFYAELFSEYGDTEELTETITHTAKDTCYIFRAEDTCYHYLKITDYDDGATFSISFENYNPVGKIVKGSDGNTYKVISNTQVELTKYAYLKERYYDIPRGTTVKNIEEFDKIENADSVLGFSVVSIGNYAFKGSKLVYVSIPETVKRIGVGAFQNCKQLGFREKIGLVIYGKNITIESKAFSGCKKLKGIKFRDNASIKSVKKNAFKGTRKGIKIYVRNIKKYRKKLKKAGFKKPKYIRSYD